MNFLQLAQRLQLECGVSGISMTTVLNNPAELNRLATWINAAWMDIQSSREDWQWMRGSVSFPTVTSQATYTPAQCGAVNLGSWARDTFRCYQTSVGKNSEMFMDYREYESWLDLYQFSANRNVTTRPNEVTITPAKAIGLGPVPIVGYTVTGDYYAAATLMALDADIPALPTQFHLAIVYRAMMSYGSFEAAPEVYQRGELEFTKYMRRLLINQLPEVTACGALA